MFRNNSIDQLQKMASKCTEQMNIQMAIFEKSLQEVKEKVTDEEKGDIERLQALSNKVINLAKKGKSDEASELIKNYNYGRKSSK